MKLNTLSVWANGGVPSIYPYQTRRSIQAAIDIGAQGVTLYVRPCQTGELVLMQDETIDALSFGHVHAGFVKYSSLEDLMKIDFAGEKLMTLPEAIRLIDGQLKTNVVLCSDDGLLTLVDIFKSMFTSQQIPFTSMMFSSHDQHQIRKFTALLPRVETGVIMSGIPIDYLEGVAALQCEHVFLDVKSAREKMLRDAETRGIKVFLVGDVSKEELSLLREQGISGILSACPQLLVPQSACTQKDVAVA